MADDEKDAGYLRETTDAADQAAPDETKTDGKKVAAFLKYKTHAKHPVNPARAFHPEHNPFDTHGHCGAFIEIDGQAVARARNEAGKFKRHYSDVVFVISGVQYETPLSRLIEFLESHGHA
jgi:hypothetical protein